MLQLRMQRPLRFGAMVMVAGLLLMLVAACGGEDATTSTPGGGAATATTSASGSATTPTAGTEVEETATSGSANAPTATTGVPREETATSVTADEPTATTEPVEEPTPTNTEEEATPTSVDAAATPGDEEDPLEDYQTLDPEELPNFSLRAYYEFENIDDTATPTTLTMEIQQAAVDNYHMRIDSGVEEELFEIWRVGDQSWTSTAGVIEESPPEMADMFGPSLFLQQFPNIAEDLNAEKVGEEEVSGRETTLYRASGDDMLELMQEDSEYLVGATDAAGEAEIWIDNEHKIMIKARVDVTWTNADGTEGRIFEEYDIFDVGDTEPISPPV